MSGTDPRLDLLRRTLGGYNRLRDDDLDGNWPELTLVAVTSDVEHPNYDEAWQKLNEAAGTQGMQGWVRYRSALRKFGRGEPPLPAVGDEEVWQPIAAEWGDGGSRSGHFRPQAGGIALWRYEERELPESGVLRKGEHPALRQCVWALEHPAPQQVANGARIPCLAYHVFWGSDEADPSALRRLFARFVGFEQREDRFVNDSQRRTRERR